MNASAKRCAILSRHAHGLARPAQASTDCAVAMPCFGRSLGRPRQRLVASCRRGTWNWRASPEFSRAVAFILCLCYTHPVFHDCEICRVRERFHAMRSETPKRSKQVAAGNRSEAQDPQSAAAPQRSVGNGLRGDSASKLGAELDVGLPGPALAAAGKAAACAAVCGRCLLTFKGAARQKSRHFKIREERETEVQDPETLGVILGRLGLEVFFCYEKYRTSYSLRLRGKRRSVDLSVDETPIGNYLEIEGTEADIHSVADKLGFEEGRIH